MDLSDSPYINRLLSADTIVPNPANPQNLNRYSYVNNNPLRYVDPSGHKPCDEYQGVCLSENQMTNIWNNTPNSNGGCGGPGLHPCLGNSPNQDKDKDDDEEITLTLDRDELDALQDLAEELEGYYQQQGDLWAWGTGAVAGVGMLVVDGLSCAGAVGSGGILTGGCIGAIYLTVVGVPALAAVAGAYGGYAVSNDFATLGGYINESLADNPQLNEFTVTVTTNTDTEVILPGGFGPTYTNYTVQITGMNSPVILSGFAGDDVVSALFGVTP